MNDTTGTHINVSRLIAQPGQYIEIDDFQALAYRSAGTGELIEFSAPVLDRFLIEGVNYAVGDEANAEYLLCSVYTNLDEAIKLNLLNNKWHTVNVSAAPTKAAQV